MEPFANKYELITSISTGHESDVWLVRKKDSDEQFLLKSLKEYLGPSKEVINRRIRFCHEMDIVSSLDHPKIARPIDTFVDDKTYAIIYPYRKGQTLAKALDKGAAYSENDAINIVFQILDALEYIHVRGIIHADINPYNVFLDDEKGFRLLDFGISMTEEEARKLPEGRIVGTLPYLAPEQMGFTDFKIDTRTDLYCTGILLYRLLSENLPFGNHTSVDAISDLLNATLKKEVPPIKKINATLNAVILKALQPSPDDRYQTAEGFKDDLRYAFRELEGHSDGLFILGEKDAIASVNRRKLFVARETEVSYLEKGYERLVQREFSSILIYARSGTGKTEIVREFSRRIAEDNCYFLPSKCNMFTPHQPYSIFRHIVCEFIAKMNRDTERNRGDFKNIVNTQLAEYSGVICQTIPEMKEFFSEVRSVDKVEPEREANRTAHVLATLLLTLCDIKPLIIFIDDLQWVDFVTFEICKRVMREKPPCMLVFNYRTDTSESDLYVFGNDLHNIGIERIVRIQPFTRDETKDLITSRFNEVKNSQGLVEMLFSKTDGNPFVLAEAIRYLVNTGLLVREELGWTYKRAQTELLPAKFDSVSLILGKEEQLNTDERHCLKLVSLIQGKFDKTLVEKFGNISETQAKICLHRFENLGFIIAHFKGGYSFSHDRIQESIAEGIQLEEKGRLYERLGGIYEAMIPENRGCVFNSAECYLKTKNLTKAIEVSSKAATFATEQVAFDVAIRYFKNTQFLIKQCSKIDIVPPVDLIRIEIAFGDVLMLTGKNEQALKMFESLLEKKNQIGKLQVLQIKYKIGSIFHNMGKFEKSIEQFKDALRDLGIDFPSNPVQILVSLLAEAGKQASLSLGMKFILPKEADFTSKIKLAIYTKLTYSAYFYDMVVCLLANLRSINLADLIIDSYEKAEAYSGHIITSYQLLLKGRAAKYGAKAVGIAEKIRRRDGIGLALTFAGIAKYYQGAWAESERILTKSISEFASLGNVCDQIISSEHLWRIDLMRGRLGSASKHIATTIELCEFTDEKHFLMATKAGQYLINLLQTGVANHQVVANINTMLEKSKSFLSHSHVAIMLLQSEILQGNYAAAYELQKPLFSPILRKCFNSEYTVPAFSLTSELLMLEARGRKKGNKKIDVTNNGLTIEFFLNMALLRFSCLSFPAYGGSYFRSKAWWHALKGNKKKAHRYFEKATKAHHSLDMRYEEARSIRDYANFLEDFCNMPGEARDKYTEAYKLFDLCGAKLETDRIKDKVDPLLLDHSEHVFTEEIEKKDDKITTSFTTTAGVNQLRVNTLYDLSNSIQNIDDTNELLQRILQSLIAATGAQFGGLFVGGDEHHQEHSLFMDFEGKTIPEKSVLYSRAMVDKVRETQTVILIKDGARDRKITGELGMEIRSALCVPLTRGKAIHGCVYLGNNMVTGLFSEDSVKTAQIIAAEASILLENAYLMDSYKRLNKDLQKKVREQTTDIRQKNKQLAESNVKVVESERMKGLLTGTLVHDIKNYVSGIEGNATLLSRSFPEDARVMKTVNIVSDCCSGIVGLASNLLDIGKMEEGKLVLKKEHLDSQTILAIGEHLKKNAMFEEKNISVTLADNTKGTFVIQADYYLVDRVLQNLFSNAVKYTPRDGRVVLSLETFGEENIICCFNSGAPIAAEDKNVLFDKYARVESKSSQYSKGLGLFFSKMVMNAHSGRIWLDTDPAGNYFKLSFRKPNVIIRKMTSPAA
jgi:serine/threonine protein kinase/signal transduction histidine kinase/tetratricopeptide (TPR) repeat protein